MGGVCLSLQKRGRVNVKREGGRENSDSSIESSSGCSGCGFVGLAFSSFSTLCLPPLGTNQRVGRRALI